MLKKLKRELYYFIDGIKFLGPNPKMYGDCSELMGNCTFIEGNGTNVFGDCSYLSGNLDDCNISDSKKNIIELIE